MDNTLENYFHDFRQNVLLRADIDSNYKRAAFLDYAADKLVQGDFIAGMEHCYYRKSGSGSVDGFFLDQDHGQLDLVIVDHNDNEGLQPIHKQSVDAAFKKLRKFYVSCRNKALYRQLEESSDAYRLAKGIHDLQNEVSKVRMTLISERKLSTRKLRLEKHDLEGNRASYAIWDMSRFHRLDSSRDGREEVDVDLHRMFRKGIPCLQAYVGAKAFPSYLGVVSGDILAGLYDEYGARLLEQNVRSFLQARGNVNRGIRRTIMEEPEMFFAYNNGITATARRVSTESGRSGSEITRMVDFQIVNGGQTTASLFHASRIGGAPDLCRIFVQMKLSVLEDRDSDEIVSNISEYANTQNKVNLADLKSNHPFQTWMEGCSRGYWAPAAVDALRETKWFYERSRGQYLDAQSTMTQGQKTKFTAEYPRAQKFTKTDLAKFENVWDEEPYWVNMGAQKNFLQYAQRINHVWAEARETFDECYYRRVVARAIVFRATEKLISRQPWYEGGYRANIVAYTLSAANEVSRTRNLALDFVRIWKEQSVSTEFLAGLAVLAKCAFDVLHAEDRPVMNPSEWAKKPEFWTRLAPRLPAAAERLPSGFWDYFAQANQAAA